MNQSQKQGKTATLIHREHISSEEITALLADLKLEAKNTVIHDTPNPNTGGDGDFSESLNSIHRVGFDFRVQAIFHICEKYLILISIRLFFREIKITPKTAKANIQSFL